MKNFRGQRAEYQSIIALFKTKRPPKAFPINDKIGP